MFKFPFSQSSGIDRMVGPPVEYQRKVVEVHLSSPLFVPGGSNELHAVRGELLGEGLVGLTILVSEDGTVDSGTLRFFPTLLTFRVLSLPWESIFCVARQGGDDR